MTDSVSGYIRLENTEAFAIYSGEDVKARKSLYVKLARKPARIRTSKYIDAKVEKRDDGRVGLTISLIDETYRSVFDAFAEDLLSSIEGEGNELLAEDKFLQRLNRWWSLFARRVEDNLPFERIVGLIGEMYFLLEYGIPSYGSEFALNGWNGPMGANQDFVLGDVWYEVKTKSADKPVVHISNMSQLADEGLGFLVVNTYAKTGSSDDKAINLMRLYRRLCDALRDPDLITLLNKKLAMVGFIPKPVYEDTNIQIKRTDFYVVSTDFPRIQLTDTQSAISRVEYDLAVQGLSDYLVREKNGKLPGRSIQ